MDVDAYILLRYYLNNGLSRAYLACLACLHLITDGRVYTVTNQCCPNQRQTAVTVFFSVNSYCCLPLYDMTDGSCTMMALPLSGSREAFPGSCLLSDILSPRGAHQSNALFIVFLCHGNPWVAYDLRISKLSRYCGAGEFPVRQIRYLIQTFIKLSLLCLPELSPLLKR